MSTNFLFSKVQKFVDNAQQCFAFTPQANFPRSRPKFEFSLKVKGSNPGYLFKCFLLYSSSEFFWPNCDRLSVECSHLKKICRPLFVPEDIFFSFCLLTVNRSPFLIPFFNSFPYRTPRSNTAILSSKVYLLVWTADWW